MNCDLDSSIPDWIIEYPETAKVFAQLRIDTSCGGKSLEYVCISQDLDPTSVLRQLEEQIRRSQTGMNGVHKHD